MVKYCLGLPVNPHRQVSERPWTPLGCRSSAFEQLGPGLQYCCLATSEPHTANKEQLNKNCCIGIYFKDLFTTSDFKHECRVLVHSWIKFESRLDACKQKAQPKRVCKHRIQRSFDKTGGESTRFWSSCQTRKTCRKKAFSSTV
mgnify:CR=1 FL=1